MCPRKLAVVLASCLALVPFARAEDQPKEQRLPWNPFEHCQKGEWVAGISKNTAMGMGPTTSVVTYTVDKVEGDTVTVTRSNKVVSSAKAEVTEPDKTFTFSTKEAPTPLHFLGMDDDRMLKTASASPIKETAETKKLGQHELACSRLEWTMEVKQGPPIKGTFVLLLSKDVKANGLVTSKTDVRDPDGNPFVQTDFELGGYGSEPGKAIWGKLPDDLVKQAKAPHKEAPRLPWNPYETAKKGDWVTGIEKLAMQGMGESLSVTTFTVQEVDGDKVTVARTTKAATKGKDGMSLNDETDKAAFSTKEAPAVRHYVWADKDALLKDGKFPHPNVSDEKKKLGDRELACSKVEAAIEVKQPSSGDAKLELVLLISKDVPGGGLVSERIDAKDEKGKMLVHDVWEVGGWGSEGKTAWGKTPEELLKEAAAGHKGK